MSGLYAFQIMHNHFFYPEQKREPPWRFQRRSQTQFSLNSSFNVLGEVRLSKLVKFEVGYLLVRFGHSSFWFWFKVVSLKKNDWTWSCLPISIFFRTFPNFHFFMFMFQYCSNDDAIYKVLDIHGSLLFHFPKFTVGNGKWWNFCFGFQTCETTPRSLAISCL